MHILANIVAQQEFGPGSITTLGGVVIFAASITLFILWLTGRQAVNERAAMAQSIRDSQRERAALEAKQAEIVAEAQLKITALYDQMLQDEREDKKRLEKRVKELEQEFTALREQNQQREKEHHEALTAIQEYQRQRETQHKQTIEQKDAEIARLSDMNAGLQQRISKLEAETKRLKDEVDSVIATHGYENELSRELEKRLRERGADTSEIAAIREAVSQRTKKKGGNGNGETVPPAGGG